MFIFFLIINLVFSAVFFFLQGISDRYYESIFFLIAGFLFFFFFSPFYLLRQKIESTEKKWLFSGISIDKNKIKNLIPNSRNLFYYGSFLLVYIAAYGILHTFNLPYEYFISGMGGFFLLLFLSSIFVIKKELFTILFRTNTIFLSIYASILVFIKLFGIWEISWWLILNSGFFLFCGTLEFFLDTAVVKKKIYVFYLIFAFIYVLFLGKLFLFENIHLAVVSIALVFGILAFEYLPKVLPLKPYVIESKYFWVLLTYFGLLYVGILISFFKGFFSVDIVILSLVWAIFQWYVHKRFENYPSYMLAIWVFVLIYTKMFFLYEVNSFFFYFLYTSVFPGLVIAYTQLIDTKRIYDYYILFVSGLFVSIGGIISYFIAQEPGADWILPGSVFALLEAALFFIGYVRLKK